MNLGLGQHAAQLAEEVDKRENELLKQKELLVDYHVKERGK